MLHLVLMKIVPVTKTKMFIFSYSFPGYVLDYEGYMILMQAPANRESMAELWYGETVKMSVRRFNVS